MEDQALGLILGMLVLLVTVPSLYLCVCVCVRVCVCARVRAIVLVLQNTEYYIHPITENLLQCDLTPKDPNIKNNNKQNNLK